MSESRTVCPRCGRLPGREAHAPNCPRSSTRQRALAADMKKRGRPRLFWAKGTIAVRALGSKPELIHNPGVPYVNTSSNGKPWHAGGIPGHIPGATELPGPVQDYIDQLSRVVERAKERKT